MFNYAAKYAGATGTQHGIVYTVLPFVALLAKPAVCSLADKYAAHHHCLLFFIFTTMLGYGSLAIYPFFDDLVTNHKDVVWILYCLAAFVGNTSMCIVNSIGDSLAINSCQKREVCYGDYRLWGPVGFGVFGAIWGIANEIPSMPKYTPGIITMVAILTINSLFLAFWYDKDEFKVINLVSSPASGQDSSGNPNNYGSTDVEQRLNGANTNTNSSDTGALNGDPVSIESPKLSRLGLLWKLGRQQSSVYAYIFLFTFCGVMTGIHWQFFFKYLEKISNKDDQSFSMVATLALPVQALGGELVFFKLSGTILKKLGSSLTLVVCLFSFAARYLLYAYLIPYVSVYWILLVELFQGPAFGLMYCVLTHQASYYSEEIDKIVASGSSINDIQLKNSLHATLQGVLGASFEGLGLGLGAIVGGLSYDATPILMWQIAGFSALSVAIICFIFAILTPIMCHSEMMPTERTINEHSNDLMMNGSEEEQILEELRRIARSCQDARCHNGESSPAMREIRKNLEELYRKYCTAGSQQ